LSKHGNVARNSGLDSALAKIKQEVWDGLRHGFFELTVTGAIENAGRRSLMIKAGKSHKFWISEDEIQ
jgi:hypothetical protein